MKTIEDFEAEIAQQNAVITVGMTKFSDNMGNLNAVVGKDPQLVFSTLEKSWYSTMDEYNTTTLRNVSILQKWVDRLDLVITVLTDVLKSIEDIRVAQGTQDQTKLDEVIVTVGEKLDEITDTVEEKMAGATPEEQHSYIKAGLVGLGSYIALRAVGIRPVLGLAGAGALAYYFGKKSSTPPPPPKIWYGA